MNLDQLKYFVSVCETGSFSITARKLSLTPQAVSKSLKQLSSELGQPLFEKSGAKLIPTYFGQSIYAEARRVTWNAGAIMDKARPRGIEAKLPSEVSIGVGYFPITGISIAPEQIQFLKTRFPNTRFEITYCLNETCFTSLQRGLFDVCIINGSYPDSTQSLIQLRVDSLAMAMISTHELARKEVIALENLSGKTVAQPSDINYFLQELVSAYEKRALEQPEYASAPFDLGSLHKLIQNNGLIFVDPKTTTIESLIPDLILCKVNEEFPPLVVSYAYENDEDSEWKQYLGNIIRRECYSL